MMLSPRLIASFVVLLAVSAFIALALSWRNGRDSLLEWQGNVVTATAEATGLKDSKGLPIRLKPKDTAQQIRYLGYALQEVRLKTAQAEADDAARARAIEHDNAKASQEASNDYQKQLAAVRADYAERVRRARGAASADQGGGGSPPVPGQPNPAGGPDAAAAQGGLPPEDALIATEQAIQLRALQAWVRSVFR